MFFVYIIYNASVNSSCAQQPPPPPPLGLLRGICPPCQSWEWGICKFCATRGPGICQPPGQPQAFDTHAVSYQNITSYWKNKQIGSFVKDGKQLKRFVKACSRFYACTSPLLIKPELHSEIRNYRQESTFIWLLNQISVDII